MVVSVSSLSLLSGEKHLKFRTHQKDIFVWGKIFIFDYCDILHNIFILTMRIKCLTYESLVCLVDVPPAAHGGHGGVGSG